MSPEVERFIQVAREFYSLLETATGREPEDLIKALRVIHWQRAW